MYSKPLKIIAILTALAFLTPAYNFEFINSEVQLPENYESNLEIIEKTTEAHLEESKYMSKNVDELKKFDKRKKKTSASPSYLDATGKIRIYFEDGRIGGCTGSLISDKDGEPSRVIQTAAHCLGSTTTEVDYDIKKFTWETVTKQGKKFLKELRVESKDYQDDVAILTMDHKIPFEDIKPYRLITEERIISRDLMRFSKKIIAAGYSADSEKGENGEVLTYDDEIKFNRRGFEGWYPIVDTVTFSGASGGPLLIEIDLSKQGFSNPHNQLYIVGTLKGGPGNVMSYYSANETGASGSAKGLYKTHIVISEQYKDY